MRFPHDRKFYVPAGAIRVADRASTAVAHIYTTKRGAPAAVVFSGKAQKPTWHHSFRDEAARESRVWGFFEAVQAVEQRRADRRAERKAWVHPYKVGDVFSTCWGYEQTNREYYEVVEVRGKHLIVREIARGYVETQWCAGKSAPMTGQFIGEPLRVLAQERGFKVGHTFASYDKPTMIAGVPTYDAQHVSSYA